MPTDPAATEVADPAPTATAVTPVERAELLERWHAAMPHQEAMGEGLIARYAEPQRRYHDARHLLAVLRRVEEFAGEQDLFLVRLAAWFHDAVYDIPERELSNEEASARLALRELSRAGLEQEDLTQIARLVRLTADHVPGSRDAEGELLCDADLAVLAGPPSDYATYVAAVRAEYAAVPDEDFWTARLAVLEPWTEGEIFRTAKGRALTAGARVNVRAEVTELTQRLGLPVAGWDT